MKSRIAFVALLAVALVFVTRLPAVADEAGDTHEGKIVSVDNGKFTMVGLDGKKQHTHSVAPDAKITLDGNACKLADLRKDMRVKVTTRKGDLTVATKIEAQSAR
jgi:hypothetical protein